MPSDVAPLALAEPISPELALVCPELRERALAQLPGPRPFLRPRLVPPVTEPLPPLPLAVAVYVAGRAAATAVEGAALALVLVLVVLGLSALT